MIQINARAATDAGILLVGWIEQILKGEVDILPKLALRLQRATRAVDEVARDLSAQEDAILRRHGAIEDEEGFVEKDGDEGTFIIDDPEKLAAATAACRELWRTEVEIAVDPLPLGELLDAGLTLTGRQALQLAALFEDHTHTGG